MAPPQRRIGIYFLFLSSIIILLFVSWSVYLLIHPKYHHIRDEHASLVKDITKLATSGAQNRSTISHSPQKSIKKEPTASQRLPILHAVTYASHHGRDDRFCRAIESALRYQYNLTILGWRVPWQGLAQKLQAAYQYTKSLPDNDVILFTDAFDVLYTAYSHQILDIFMEKQYQILFAGECGCWPHIIEDASVCFKSYPPAPTPYRYLNSGTWIAIAKHARMMLKAVIDRAGNKFINANDQKLVADMYIGKEFPISLDYYAEIFQSMHRTDPPGLPYCNPSQDISIDTNNHIILNRRTNTTPGVFHFNGGGKAFHLNYESKAPYKTSQHYSSPLVDGLLHTPVEVIKYTDKSPDGARSVMQYKDFCEYYVVKEKKGMGKK